MSPRSPVAAADQGAAPARPASCDSLAGTTWEGTDSHGSFYVFHFQPDGALHYTNPNGNWRKATWKQDGASVYFETNDRYSEYSGTIDGDRMSGSARNRPGHQWTFQVERRR